VMLNHAETSIIHSDSSLFVESNLQAIPVFLNIPFSG
jgi:hypothetical protein